MPSYVYALKLLSEPYIKIGKSLDPITRCKSLPHKFLLEESFVLMVDTDAQAYSIESMLHKVFEGKNIKLDGDGGTEFFHDEIADDLIAIFKSISVSCGVFLQDYFLSGKSPIVINEELTESIPRSLAAKCRSLRLSKNVSQGQISEATGIAESTYKKFEQTGEISLERLTKVLVALNDSDFIEWATRIVSTRRSRARQH